jgi:hypothetical protein
LKVLLAVEYLIQCAVEVAAFCEVVVPAAVYRIQFYVVSQLF